MQCAIQEEMVGFFAEDGLGNNFFYHHSLPSTTVPCRLKFQDDLLIAGLPWFAGAFRYLDPLLELKLSGEGKAVSKTEQFELSFHLPFALTVTGERIALNLLQRACSIASYTARCVAKAAPRGIAILDTRKTTPGLRQLEKYAVRVGGGQNHRMSQNDTWMIKDNHKTFFGSVKKAVDFFRSQGTFYHRLVVEVHHLTELSEALELGVSHIMLDNFSSEQIAAAIALKPPQVTYEVSGGVNLENMDEFLIKGIDAISMGCLTQGAPAVDISLKYG